MGGWGYGSIGAFYTLMTLMNWILQEEKYRKIEAEPDDLIVYMTSQKNPFLSYKTKIKREQWHTFFIKHDIKFKT
jgi:hypothetical protein